MKRFLFVAVIALVCVQLASAHIRIYPTESSFGAREKYTMRVPNEKQVGSSKVEGEFPAELNYMISSSNPAGRSISKKMIKARSSGRPGQASFNLTSSLSSECLESIRSRDRI